MSVTFEDSPMNSGSSVSSGSSSHSCSRCNDRMSSIDRDTHLICFCGLEFDCYMQMRCQECVCWSKEEMMHLIAGISFYDYTC